MNKTKTIVSIISIILVLAMIAGLIGYLSGGFKNWNVKDWFAKENTEKPDDNKGNDKTDIKERSVAFDLKFDTLDEANGYYTASLTKDQKAALLDYPNTYFFAEITGEYNGKEQAKAKIPMIFFVSYDPGEPALTVGFSDTGSFECNVAIALPVIGNDDTKIEAVSMAALEMSFTLTFPEDSIPVGKAIMDTVQGTGGDTETFGFAITPVNKLDSGSSSVYTTYFAEKDIEALPEERDYTGKVIFAESVTSTGETVPEKTVDVTWKYSNGSGTADGVSVYIHDWTYCINERNGQYDVRLRKIVRKSDNTIFRIEAESYGHGFCTLVFNK